MIRPVLSSFALLTVIAGTPTLAATRIPATGIPLSSAQISRIRNWSAANDRSVYVQSQSRKWYKAELAQPCWGMEEANRIKVNMTDGDRFDQNSTVQVHGERCRVASVYRVEGPVRPLLDKPI